MRFRRIGRSGSARRPRHGEWPVRRAGLSALCAAALAGAAAGSGWAGSGLSLEFDGVTRAFEPQMDGARTGFTRFLTVDAVSIEGTDGRARFVVELSMPPTAGVTDGPHDARLIYRPDGWRDYWMSPPGIPEGAIAIEHVDLSGPAPRIAGSFLVPLCFTASPLHAPDLERCLPASGAFDTALVRD